MGVLVEVAILSGVPVVPGPFGMDNGWHAEITIATSMNDIKVGDEADRRKILIALKFNRFDESLERNVQPNISKIHESSYWMDFFERIKIPILKRPIDFNPATHYNLFNNWIRF